MRVVFMGTPAFALPVLEGLIDAGYAIAGVVTQPDRPAGRGRQPAAPPAKALAQAHGLALYQPASLRRPEAIDTIRRWQPEAIVVAAFGQLVPPEILHLPPLGCLNVHPSLLPQFRGASPIAAALLAGLERTGVTIMLMDEGLDTGPILAQQEVAIAPADTALTLGQRLAQEGGKLLPEVLPRWANGEILPQPQNPSAASHTRPLRKEDGLVEWRWPAVELWRRWRAHQPWPGSYTYWQGKLLKLVAVTPLPRWRSPAARPGEVLLVDSERGPALAVATGEGALLLEQVQLEGRQPMAGAAFLRGHRALLGAVLGK